MTPDSVRRAMIDKFPAFQTCQTPATRMAWIVGFLTLMERVTREPPDPLPEAIYPRM